VSRDFLLLVFFHATIINDTGGKIWQQYQAADSKVNLRISAVDGNVVLEELTSAVATTVGVRFTFKLSSGFFGA
jgi:hypothetical protein